MPRSPACRASAVQSSTLSHGMCTAMRGATPVKRCTCAASSAFSHGVRGTPGWPNTLNRVPEFPKAQEGSSISCPFSAALTAVRSRIWCSSPLSVHVKYLADPLESLVGRKAVEFGEVGRHVPLPPGVDLGRGHAVERGLVILRFQVSNQQPVLRQEQAVVPPPGLL